MFRLWLNGSFAVGVLLLFTYCSATVYEEFHIHLQKERPGRQEQMEYHAAPILNVRNDSLPARNDSDDTTSTLQNAIDIVKAAQSEARQRNLRLLANPRTNIYELMSDVTTSSLPIIQEDGTVTTTTPDGTGVNSTVGSAAMLVAEAVASNSSQTLGNLKRKASSYWMENMVQNGASPFAPAGYKVWRNVRDYGAQGDGKTDDTEAINRAISDGNRCGKDCGSTTTLQAVVYFPSGTYLVSRSILTYYFTQMIGDPTDPPIIKVAPSFVGLGVISSNQYIEGGDGASWYINQSNFYRQVRNFVIDMTAGPQHDYIAGLHWQVAQATSLQNIKFKMSATPGNNQQGIFMENGSGGLMSDLEFVGGALGAYVGNQQFTVRNLKFSGHSKHAIEIHWDWGWTWKGIHIENCPTGVVMWGPDPTALGSAIFLDSSMSAVGVGLRLGAPGETYGRITPNLFNVKVSNVGTVVEYDNGKVLLPGGSKTIAAWGLGKRYDTNSGESSGVWQEGSDYEASPNIVSSLLDGASGFFQRSKPQYENIPASQFINVKMGPYSAAGDGIRDDTSALNNAFRDSASSGRILWIPAGVYVVLDTVTIPRGAKVVGQSWSQIMGSGQRFSDISKPYPVVKVGESGDVGSVEIQDLLFTVRGATAGAVVLQWNIHESDKGSAAMWDTHVRVGGAAGTGLQAKNCPKLTGKVNQSCIGASMLVHITSRASAYFENTWFWVADHDLDIPAQTQIDIYVGRGLLIESTSPVWLYGTSSEHCVLYQYQTVDAANVFMGMIQTESPYFQAVPRAPEPFTQSASFPEDPSFDYCDPASRSCAMSWGVRILNSANIYIYGAGLYSWFQEYGQACVAAESCQDRIFQISTSSSIWIYSLITKASLEMISPDGGISVLGKDNKVNYCNIVMAWMGSAGSGSPPHGGGGGAIHRSPSSATVIPFPATTVGATATFTVVGPVVSQIDHTLNNGNQNLPPGPGHESCSRCDLARLITSTCCGIGGGVSNPLEIGPNTPIPRSMILPRGFVPNQQLKGDDNTIHAAGQPLAHEVIVPIGTIFPIPFLIPPGLRLSDRWSPVAESYDSSRTLYLTSDFWRGSHSVSCDLPCILVFPPITTTTTWDPPPFAISTSTLTTTTNPPPYTTEHIWISKTTVAGPKPTAKIQPAPRPKPLCFKLNIFGIRVKLCPPPIFPFPPRVPIPAVTVIPVPPGRKPGPTNLYNKPSPEQEEGEEEEDDSDSVCPIGDNVDYQDDDWDEDYPGIGEDNQQPDWVPPAAGVGTPTTTTVTVTVPESTKTVTADATTTVVVTPPPVPEIPPRPPQADPEPPRTPIPDQDSINCYFLYGMMKVSTRNKAVNEFCEKNDDVELDGMPGHKYLADWRAARYEQGGEQIYMRVDAKPGCRFRIDRETCNWMFRRISFPTCLVFGGQLTNNCASWVMYPLHAPIGPSVPSIPENDPR